MSGLVADPVLCLSDCEECGGSGYVRNDVAVGHPDFGKVELCPNVDRWSLASSERYGLKKSEIEDLNWKSLIEPQKAIEAIIKAKELIEEGHGWLYIFGSYGLAKTFILKIVVATLLRQNEEAAYVRMAEVMDHLRSSFDTPEANMRAEMKLDWWSELPFLAIDEFDRMRPTEYATERQFVLMDRRYESAIREETATIMASNKAPDDLPGADNGYLADRIMDGRFHIVELVGPSLRKEFTR